MFAIDVCGSLYSNLSVPNFIAISVMENEEGVMPTWEVPAEWTDAAGSKSLHKRSLMNIS